MKKDIRLYLKDIIQAMESPERTERIFNLWSAVAMPPFFSRITAPF
jgi:uncharacterized protein with HEPN domain